MTKLGGPKTQLDIEAKDEIAQEPSNQTPEQNLLEKYRVWGMPLTYFLVMFGLLVVAAFTDNLPPVMIVGFTLTMMLGALFVKIGDSIPVLRNFGLPIILCLVVPAVLVQLGWMPEAATAAMTAFTEDHGFTDFVIIGVIAGTILGMPRKLLIKAGIRYAVPVLGTIGGVFALIGVLAELIGFGFVQGVLFIAGPIMAGGVPIGALPMSQMYADQVGGQQSDFLGELMSAVIFANIICVLVAAILNGIGKSRAKPFEGFNGKGELMRGISNREVGGAESSPEAARFMQLAHGLIFSGVVFVAGTLLGEWMPFLHPYAWATALAALLKISGLVPKDLEASATAWADMVVKVFVPALVVAISVSVIDIDAVVGAFQDPRFVILTVATVLIAGTLSGILGYLLKFYFIEAVITPGLMMADTGGSGDIAVLSAADRMALLPFATIATRLGGVIVLFVTSLVVPLLTAAML